MVWCFDIKENKIRISVIINQLAWVTTNKVKKQTKKDVLQAFLLNWL